MKNTIKLLLATLSVAMLTACGGGGGGGNAETKTVGGENTTTITDDGTSVDDDAGNTSNGGSSDTTLPYVASTSPINNASGVALNRAIAVTFSESMSTFSVNSTSFSINNGVTGTIAYSGLTATFTPSTSLAYNTTYTATITTAAKDLAGNALENNYTWSFTTDTAPQPSGSLDTTFNTTGKVSTVVGINSNSIRSTAVQIDGKIVAAGFAYENSGGPYGFALARYNTNGSLDTSFNSTGKIITVVGRSSDVRAIALQSDGKIVAAGRAYNDSPAAFGLARFNNDGSLDTTFNITGKVITFFGTSNSDARAIAIQPDGKIVVAGRSGNGTYDDFALARYNNDGSLDTSFNSTGKVITVIGTGSSFASAITIQTDGKIVVAGSSTANSGYGFVLARYNTNGSLDTSFNSTGVVITTFGTGYTVGTFAESLAKQSDGKLVVAGNAVDGVNSGIALVRYNANGSLDTTFNSSGIIITGVSGSAATAIAIQLDGKIVTVGYESNSVHTIYRFNSNGSFDTSFNFTGKSNTSINGRANAVSIQSDGKIVTAGHVMNGVYENFSLMRFWP